MENLSAKDLQVFREKSRTFCGSFRVPLDKLQHEELPNNPRQRDGKNVARLLSVFRAEDCQRREHENHMPALVSRSVLPQARRTDGVSFEEPQWFIPESPLRILHGRHRLEAARKFLEGSDRWWVVDLYSDDLNTIVKNELREQDPNSSRWYDGDIVRQIRLCALTEDSSLPDPFNQTARREKWLARLSKSKRKCLLRLEALPGKFLESLDDLIPLAGLWPPVQIGTFPRLLKLHCPEEITRYLRRVKKTWTYIIGDKEHDQLQMDANTVALLQGRCPFRSTEDHGFIRMRMLAGDILPAVKDDQRRSEIFNRICSVEHIIPSIYTCIENTKWLEPGVRILKELLPKNGKGSISQQFRTLHNRQVSMKVQTSEFTSEDRTLPSGDSFWLSYRQIFLFSLRHFPVMDGQAPRKDTTKQSSPHPGIQQRWWHELSSLAFESGYRGLRRKYGDRKAADAKAIEDCVRSILPSKYYQIDSNRMRRIVQLNCQLMQDVPYADRMKVVPELTSDHDDCGSDISDRCGRPHDRSFQADQESLFLDFIYSTSYSTNPQRYLTSFALKRDFFHSFFGSGEDDLDRQLHCEIARDNVAKDEDDDEILGDADQVIQTENTDTGLVGVDSAEAQSSGQRLLSLGNLSNLEDEGNDEVLGDADQIIQTEDIDTGLVGLDSAEAQSPDQRLMLLGNLSNTEKEDTGNDEVLGDADQIIQTEDIDIRLIGLDRAEAQSPGQRLLTSSSLSDTKKDDRGELHPSGLRPPMYEFGQQNHDGAVSLAEASRLLFKPRTGKKRLFTVLSPMAGNRFHKRQADALDNTSMVTALELPSESQFIALDKNKRLKMTAPTMILDAARTQRLQAVLMVKQSNVRELIRKFDNHDATEEELDDIS